jgi:hypothetical protein
MNPTSQQPAQPPVAPPASYPLYYAYPYGYYPWYQPAPATLPPTPAERPARPGGARRANLALSLVLAMATLGALLLAAIAPSLAQYAPSAPAGGLTQLYSMSLTSDSGDWELGNGCAFEQGGLHAHLASDATLCAFMPSTSYDLTSQGFYVATTVGPAAALAGLEEPCMQIATTADVYTLAFNQQGSFGFRRNPSRTCALSGALTPLDTSSWHANGITPNRIAVRYEPDAQTLVVYVNDQQIVAMDAALSGPVQVSLGSSGGGEAVYTSFALYGAGSVS